MGGLIGGVFNSIGSSNANNQLASSGQAASNAALTGYRYATGAGNQYIQPYQANGVAANNSIAQLLGQAPITSQTQNGFNNYLNSTGYNFQLQQGTNALASQGSASGLLQSGGAAKALTQYGQNLASTNFNNYLSQLSGLSGAGQNATGSVVNAGTYGGGAAANALTQTGIQQAGAQQAQMSSLGTGIGSLLGGIFSFG